MFTVKPYWDVLYSDLYLLLQLHAASCFHDDINLWHIRRRCELLGELYPRVLILTVKHSIQRDEVYPVVLFFHNNLLNVLTDNKGTFHYFCVFRCWIRIFFLLSGRFDF